MFDSYLVVGGCRKEKYVSLLARCWLVLGGEMC